MLKGIRTELTTFAVLAKTVGVDFMGRGQEYLSEFVSVSMTIAGLFVIFVFARLRNIRERIANEQRDRAELLVEKLNQQLAALLRRK
jgi:hypothetical protein